MQTAPRKGSWSKPLADLVGRVIDPVLATQGFGQSEIVLRWREIAGERLAAVSEPLRLQWPSRGRNPSPDSSPQPATLIVRTEGGFAVELQHLAPLIVDRINARLGWRCVGRLTFRQGPLRAPTGLLRRPLTIDPEARVRAAEAAAPVADEKLRGALERLGSRVLSRPRAKT